MVRQAILLLVCAIFLLAVACAIDSALGDSFDFFPFLLTLPFKLVVIVFIFLVAFSLHRLAWHIAGSLLHSSIWKGIFLWSSNRLAAKRFAFEVAEVKVRSERQQTIHHLVASLISILTFIVAVLLSLSQFLSGETLAILAGLFTAAFSLGARPIIADMLSGISFIFEDNFDVGEKVEIASVTGKVEGVIERMSLQTAAIRAPTGELYIVPNSEIRILRNFSRGRFSTANLKLKLMATDLKRALPQLEALGDEAVTLLPDLLAPWQVISEEGEMGEHVELILLSKARFGQAAELRPHLLALVQNRLAEAGITLTD